MFGVRHRWRGGFTLVELLVVIVIIGIMALLFGPNITAGSDMSRVKSASRAAMQLSRYARTMALLHQTPVEVEFSSSGRVRVRVVESGGGAIVSSRAFAGTNVIAIARRDGVEEEEEEEEEGVSVPQETGSGGSSYQMGEVDLEKEFEGIVFSFDSYTDTFDGGQSARYLSERERERAFDDDGVEEERFTIRYRSNGTCRPHRFKIAADSEGAHEVVVVVNMLGAAQIEGDER